MRQAASPVRWVETIRRMVDAGVTHIVECGPGKVLAGMTKRIAPGRASRFAAADRASLEEALEMLEGKVALVTGASRGIGHAIADELREHGAKVVGTATTRGQALEEAFQADRARLLDVRDAAPVRRARESIQKELGDDPDPGEQRRHHARQPGAAHEGRGVGRGDRDQPARACFACRAR